ncbi:hypothetical protein [Persicobacter psychrovividus]
MVLKLIQKNKGILWLIVLLSLIWYMDWQQEMSDFMEAMHDGFLMFSKD